MIRIIILSIALQGCAVALPLAGAGGTIRSEYKYRSIKNMIQTQKREIETIKERLDQSEKIIDYLIEGETSYDGENSNETLAE